MIILAIDSALSCRNIDELVPFLGLKAKFSDLFSEDGVEHAVVSEDHSSSGLGCIERDLKVMHADLIAELQSKFSDDAEFACCSCERLCQRKQVSHVNFSLDKYETDAWQRTNALVLQNGVTEQLLYICQYCRPFLNKNTIPARCVLNGLVTEPTPQELKSLNALCKQLIQRAKAFQIIVRLGTYSDELVPFLGLKAKFSDLFSEDGVEHAVVSEDHSSSGLGCIERDLKVMHADLIAELQSKFSDDAEFACCSCERLCQRKQVSHVNFSLDKYETDAWQRTNALVLQNGVTEQLLYICQYCRPFLNKNTIPARCVLNGLVTEPTPQELKSLNALCKQLIQRAKAFQIIVRLGTYSGVAAALPPPPAAAAALPPPPPAEAAAELPPPPPAAAAAAARCPHREQQSCPPPPAAEAGAPPLPAPAPPPAPVLAPVPPPPLCLLPPWPAATTTRMALMAGTRPPRP
ncbi:hypothetical protein EMCRGX_G017739 [Ephydatia muelleri]